MSDDVYVARESFVTHLDGERIVVRKGQTRVRAGHVLLEGRMHLFKPVDVQYDVETARQEPVPAPGPVAAVKKAVAKKAAPPAPKE